MELSVVIIAKNEALNIVDCILSAKKVSRDIVVVDTGSTDCTALLAQREGAKVFFIKWCGYGNARNAGAQLAYHDWILSLDADERITEELAQKMRGLDPGDPQIVYGFRRENYFGTRRIRFGEPANDRVFRVYNRQKHTWDLVPVHEKLDADQGSRVLLLPKIIHLGIRGTNHYRHKKMHYASLCAIKYFGEKRKLAIVLKYLSPAFNFIKGYFFQLGFLDLRVGLTVAKINAGYTRKKYSTLHTLQKQNQLSGYDISFLRSPVRKIISFLS